MAIEVKVPLLPESISDATVSTWHKKAGDSVSRDENIVDLETDKVMLEVPSPVNGVIKKIIKETGGTVHAQEVLAIIDEGEAKPAAAKPAVQKAPEKAPEKAVEKERTISPPPVSHAEPASPSKSLPLSPSERRALAEGRLSSEKAAAISSKPALPPLESESTRPEKRVPMTRIRARIAERLLEVKQNTAMLTTFNEINMASVMALRNRYKDTFEKKNHIRLGFMSFFVRACVEALKRSPIVNASLDGNDIVYHGYYDIGVAVSTDRGLIVPVLRDADQMSMAEIEAKIVEAAEKARAGKLSLEEMKGGTFTITNGGVFGSLLATPLLNSPQCAILGMHKIEERPVVEKGEIVIRPMMYVALSYDHQIIDGKESVTFLVTIKDLLEDPTRLILEV